MRMYSWYLAANRGSGAKRSPLYLSEHATPAQEESSKLQSTFCWNRSLQHFHPTLHTRKRRPRASRTDMGPDRKKRWSEHFTEKEYSSENEKEFAQGVRRSCCARDHLTEETRDFGAWAWP